MSDKRWFIADREEEEHFKTCAFSRHDLGLFSDPEEAMKVAEKEYGFEKSEWILGFQTDDYALAVIPSKNIEWGFTNQRKSLQIWVTRDSEVWDNPRGEQ